MKDRECRNHRRAAWPKRRDREVLRAEDFSEDDLEAIAAAKVPEAYALLDGELGDWRA